MVRKNRTPIRAKKTNVIERLAALKRGLRNTVTSSIGCGVRRSQAMKVASPARPTAKAARIDGAPQPRSGASITAQTIADRAAIDRPAPATSSLGFSGSRDSGTNAATPTSATATIGRLTRNMLFQLKCSSSQPPVIGPTAMPMPETAAQAAIALGRSCAGKMLVRIDSVVGMIPAAPRPISAREAISASAVSDKAASSEPASEDDEPGHERPAAAEAVAEAAGGQQQAGEHEQVAVDDPLQLAGARAELVADRRQARR